MLIKQLKKSLYWKMLNAKKKELKREIKRLDKIGISRRIVILAMIACGFPEERVKEYYKLYKDKK